MRLGGLFALCVLTLLGGCGSRGDVADIAGMHSCGELLLESGELQPGECRLDAGGQTMRVRYSDASGETGGSVSLDVLDEQGVIVQTLIEESVSEYLAPSVQDVDGDGRADVLVGRASGNVNTAFGVWIYSGARDEYRRVGEVSGYDVSRTRDGLIAVQARSGAALRNVAFYSLDESGLSLIVTVELEARELPGGDVRWSCRLGEAPGAPALGLTAQAVEERFCSEPIATGESL